MSQSKGAARDLSDTSETERAAPCLENDGFDPELDAKLKLAAEEMVREVLEECENEERARACNIKKTRSSVSRSESVENEEADGSG